MAWLKTDWENELDQVERRVEKVLNEKVEPMADRMIEKATSQISTTTSQATYELQDITKNFLDEVKEQRREMVNDLKAIIRYAALVAFAVVVASVVVITVARHI